MVRETLTEDQPGARELPNRVHPLVLLLFLDHPNPNLWIFSNLTYSLISIVRPISPSMYCPGHRLTQRTLRWLSCCHTFTISTLNFYPKPCFLVYGCISDRLLAFRSYRLISFVLTRAPHIYSFVMRLSLVFALEDILL